MYFIFTQVIILPFKNLRWKSRNIKLTVSKWKIQWNLVVTMLYNHIYLVSKHFYHSQIKPLIHKTVTFIHSLLPRVPGNHQSAFFPLDLPMSYVSYKRNHTICDSWCLTSFHLACFQVLPHCSTHQRFWFSYSWLNNSLLYVYTKFIYPFILWWPCG